MSRVLVLLLAVLAFFWLLRRALSSRKEDDAAAGQSTERKSSSGAPAAIPDLVPCAHCGVLMPKEEALVTGVDAGVEAGAAARYFCSEAHRRAGARR